MFLGANQDAITTGTELGFAPESAIDFDENATSIHHVVASASEYIATNRSGGRGSFTEEDRRNASRRRS